MNELEELKNEAYDNAKIYKDKTKKWHDLKYFEEGISSRRSGPVIQLQIETVSRKTEIKMEWSLYSSGKYNLWSSDIEN